MGKNEKIEIKVYNSFYARDIPQETMQMFLERCPKNMSNRDVMVALMNEVIAGRLYFENGKVNVKLI